MGISRKKQRLGREIEPMRSRSQRESAPKKPKGFWGVITVFLAILVFSYGFSLRIIFTEGLNLVSSILGHSAAGFAWQRLGTVGEISVMVGIIIGGLGTFIVVFRNLERRPWLKLLTQDRLAYRLNDFVKHFSALEIDPKVATAVFLSLQASTPISNFPVMPNDPLIWYMADPGRKKGSITRSVQEFLAFLFTESDLADKGAKVPKTSELKLIRTAADLVQIAAAIYEGRH